MLLALTVKQPWAWLIASGHKQLENRTWSPPQSVIGKWIAIHAGLEDDVLAVQQVYELHDIFVPGGLVRGAIVAVAHIEKVALASSQLTPEQQPWWLGPRAWVLDQVVALPEPVTIRGAQKLWRVPEVELGQVREQWREARRRAAA